MKKRKVAILGIILCLILAGAVWALSKNMTFHFTIKYNNHTIDNSKCDITCTGPAFFILGDIMAGDVDKAVFRIWNDGTIFTNNYGVYNLNVRIPGQEVDSKKDLNVKLHCANFNWWYRMNHNVKITISGDAGTGEQIVNYETDTKVNNGEKAKEKGAKPVKDDKVDIGIGYGLGDGKGEGLR